MPSKDVDISISDDLFNQILDVSPLKQKHVIEIANNDRENIQKLDEPFHRDKNKDSYTFDDLDDHDKQEWINQNGEDFSSSPTIPMDSPSMHQPSDNEQRPTFTNHQFFVKTKSSYADEPSSSSCSFKFSQVMFGNNTRMENTSLDLSDNKENVKSSSGSNKACKNDKNNTENQLNYKEIRILDVNSKPIITTLPNQSFKTIVSPVINNPNPILSRSQSQIQSPNVNDVAPIQKAEILNAIAIGLRQYNVVLTDFDADVQPRSDYLVCYLNEMGFNLKTKMVNDYLAEIRNDRLDPEVKSFLNNDNYTTEVNKLLAESNKRRKCYNKRKTYKNDLTCINSEVNLLAEHSELLGLSSHPALHGQTLVPIAMASSKTGNTTDINPQMKTNSKVKQKSKEKEKAKPKTKITQREFNNDLEKLSRDYNFQGLTNKTKKNTALSNNENDTKFSNIKRFEIFNQSEIPFKLKSEKPKSDSFSSTTSSVFKLSSLTSSSYAASTNTPISSSIPASLSTPKSSTNTFTNPILEPIHNHSLVRSSTPINNTSSKELDESLSNGNLFSNLTIDAVKIETLINKKREHDDVKCKRVSFVNFTNINNYEKEKNDHAVTNKLNTSKHLFKMISDSLTTITSKKGSNSTDTNNKSHSLNISITELPISLYSSTSVNMDDDQMISYIEVTLNISQFNKFLNYNSNSVKNGNFTSIIQLKSITRVYNDDQLLIKRCDPINASFIDDSRQTIKIILPLQAKLWAGLINDYHNGICDGTRFNKLKISHTLLINDELLNFKNFKKPLHAFIWDFKTNTQSGNSYTLSNFNFGDLKLLNNRPQLHTFSVNNSNRKEENTVKAQTATNPPRTVSPLSENEVKIPLPNASSSNNVKKTVQRLNMNVSTLGSSIKKNHPYFNATQTYSNSLRSKSEIQLQSKASLTPVHQNTYSFPANKSFNNASVEDSVKSDSKHYFLPNATSQIPVSNNIPTIADDFDLNPSNLNIEKSLNASLNLSRGHKRTRSRSMNQIDFMALPLSFDGFVSMPFLDSFTPSDIALSPADNVINPSNKKQNNFNHQGSTSKFNNNNFSFSTDTSNSTLLSDFKYLNNSDSQIQLKGNNNPILFENEHTNTLDFSGLSDVSSSHFTENNTPINTNQSVTSIVHNMDVSQSFLVDSEINFSDSMSTSNDY